MGPVPINENLLFFVVSHEKEKCYMKSRQSSGGVDRYELVRIDFFPRPCHLGL